MPSFRKKFLVDVRARHALALSMLVGVGLALTTTGCIRSRVILTTEPAGAEVTWRGQYRGVTPIEIPFKWYWYHDYTLEKEGYETVEKIERFRTPPWFLLPLDLFAEIIPVPIPDRRRRHYVLEKEEADF